MPELIAVIVFVAVLFIIEIVYLRRSQPTSISEHVQDLNRKMSKQLIAGILFALGLIAGWLIAHFTTFC